jgi:hypothetical protein
MKKNEDDFVFKAKTFYRVLSHQNRFSSLLEKQLQKQKVIIALFFGE